MADPPPPFRTTMEMSVYGYLPYPLPQLHPQIEGQPPASPENAVSCEQSTTAQVFQARQEHGLDPSAPVLASSRVYKKRTPQACEGCRQGRKKVRSLRSLF